MTASQTEKVFSFIENSKKDMVELQSILTAIPAIAPQSGGQGEFEKCQALEKYLKSNGITNLERFDAPDKRVKSGIRPNLVATIAGADSSRTLWIMSHLDVVPEGEISLWNTDPFQVTEKDGKLYGRGAEDDQQGLVASVFASLALVKQNIMPAYTVKLLFVADEEVGSEYGICWLIKNHKELFKKNDLIIIPDGGDSKGETVEIAEKNLLWLKITTKGKQAHGSTPDEGRNAHLANCDLAIRINALENFYDKRDKLFTPDRSTFQPTKKEANVPNINTIPGEDTIYFDCRILPCYPLKVVQNKINEIISEIEAKYSVKISTTIEQSAESPATPADAPVVQMLLKAVKQVYNNNPKPVGIGGGTVGASLRQEGLYATVWCKQDETMHQPNEYCIIENLVGDAKVFGLIMLSKVQED
ncbi:MAG: M20 family metallo-hydrolase [Spirochaetaceae bacterium]|nr:M20 family metallo-hydrolase [Spirochaetaceae bacterium]